MDKTKTFITVSDFLNDDMFIAWRLFRTEEAEQYWRTFVVENPQLTSLLQEACRMFDAVRLNESRLSSDMKDVLYEKICIRTHKQIQRKRQIYRLVVVAAASCLLLIGLSVTLLMQHRKLHPSVVRNEIVGETLPLQHVQLISGDEVINLQSDAYIVLSEAGEAAITDGESHVDALQLTENKPNKLIVPYGKRSFVTLADGTKVWLNSGTEFTFPTRFTGSSRDVHVKGEIYIEVVQSEQPFLVHTERAVIRVTGTRFNVSAYAGEPDEAVVLVSGCVRIEVQDQPVLTLFPNEKATVSSNSLTKENVNTSEYVGWRDGVMIFNKTPMTEVLKKVGRYYNVSFEESPDAFLKEKTVSGKLFLSDNLDNVMTLISILSSTDYERENNHIFIRKKQ